MQVFLRFALFSILLFSGVFHINAQTPEPNPTQAPAELTATQLIQQITQTAEITTGNTAVPLPTESANNLTIDEAFALTATQFIVEVTATAEAFPIPADEVEEFGQGVFIIVIGSLLLGIVIMIGIIMLMNRSRWNS